MVWAVPVLVVPTMSSVAVDVPVAPWEPALPAPVLVATVAVPAPGAPVAPVAYTGRVALELAVVPMATSVFDLSIVPVAPPPPPGPESETHVQAQIMCFCTQYILL